MRFRTLALALALVCGFGTMAEAKNKPHGQKPAKAAKAAKAPKAARQSKAKRAKPAKRAKSVKPKIAKRIKTKHQKRA